MKLFVGGIVQETNSFSPYPTDLGRFEQGYLLSGDAIPERLRGTNTEVGGFYTRFECETPVVEIVPGLAAWAVAAGPLTSQTFRQLTDRLLDALRAAGTVDGVLLALHGALVAEDEDDCEGALLQRVREVVGPSSPIVCTLDYHAVVTDRMLDNTDMLVGYRTYPHVDMAATGERAAEVLLRLIREKPKFKQILERIPMILPVDNTETGRPPMREVIERLDHWESQPGVIGASLFCTHPWLDLPDHGVALLVYAAPDRREAIRREMDETAAAVWSRRAAFFTHAPDIQTFLRGLGRYEKPVIAIDSGDVTSAGAAGDSTVVLWGLRGMDRPPRTILSIVDPAAVEEAFAAGEGAVLDFTVGGRPGSSAHAAFGLRACVRRLANEPIEVKGAGAAFAGIRLDMGRRALLESEPNIYLLVTEFASLMHDPEVLRSMGVDPAQFDLIVQKTHKLFRPAYAGIARTIVTIDTPGDTDRNVERLPFTKLKRPIYPLDEVENYK